MACSSSSASWSSPCAACKFLRRKCTAECVFAPYFPPDQPQKFANVHKIFGASNITKLLNELPLHQREDAVNSLAYEADARVKDPVYGCVGVISILQRQASRLQQQLSVARTELSRYSSPPPPSLMDPIGGSFGTMQQHNTLMIDLMQLTAREQQQLMQIQRETHNDITREQLLNHLSASRVANNSSLYAEVGHFGLASFSSSSIRHGGDGGSTSSGGGSSLGHLSPP